jgi:hypothetical protein
MALTGFFIPALKKIDTEEQDASGVSAADAVEPCLGD